MSEKLERKKKFRCQKFLFSGDLKITGLVSVDNLIAAKSGKLPNVSMFSSSAPVRRYKQYTEDTLQLALKEIMEGQSINR